MNDPYQILGVSKNATDEEIINALLSTGYSEELPAYNDITNVETGADIIESHIANNSTIPNNMALLAKSEGKDPVEIDKDKLEKMGVHVIAEKLMPENINHFDKSL